jgi:hypothetical protein
MRSTKMRAERRSSPLVVGGGTAIAALLALALFTGGDPVEQAASTPPSAPSPPPVPVAPASPPPAVASSSPDGLRLHGVAGAGAIIGLPDGGQRLIPIGRDVLPGLALASVGVDHALLRSSTATYRLGFDGVAAGATGVVPAGPASAPDAAALRRETVRYRLSLAPVSADGRVVGHRLRVGADAPALARAGLRPGDVIRRVNGAAFNGEQLEELAWTIANSSEVTFEIERQGVPMSAALMR